MKVDTKKLKKIPTAGEIRNSLQKPKYKDKITNAVKSGTEDVLQKQCEAYLTIKGIWYLHIPASVYQSGKAQSIAGVPDLLIFKKEWISPKTPDLHNSCLLVELKTVIGKRNPKQVKWAKETNVNLIRSVEDFISLVNEWDAE